jgi:hypothetical protein
LPGLIKPDLETLGLVMTVSGANTTAGFAGAGAGATASLALGLVDSDAAFVLEAFTLDGAAFAGVFTGALTGEVRDTLAVTFGEVLAGAFTAALEDLPGADGFLATGFALTLVAVLAGWLGLTAFAAGLADFGAALTTALAGALVAAALTPVFLAAGLATVLETGLALALGAVLDATFFTGAALALTTGFFTILGFFFTGAFTSCLLADPAAP